MRRMADSVTPTDIPTVDPITGRPWDLVAGYIDGRYAWTTDGWARFPASLHVGIAVFSTTNAGDVIDRETGDATADQAVDWVVMRRNAGHPNPTVYCSYSDWLNCQNRFLARGVSMPSWWIAGYPSPTDNAGHPIIPAGAVAHQFTDTPGGHWDESIVADTWPGIDKEDSMTSPQDVWAYQIPNPNYTEGADPNTGEGKRSFAASDYLAVADMTVQEVKAMVGDLATKQANDTAATNARLDALTAAVQALHPTAAGTLHVDGDLVVTTPATPSTPATPAPPAAPQS